MSESMLPMNTDRRPSSSLPQCVGCSEHATIQTHEAIINNTQREIGELKDRMSKMENRYDVIYEMASSIKVLSTQITNVNDNVHEMKTDFTQDIKDIKQKQSSISDKVDKIEVESAVGRNDNERKNQFKNNLLYSVVEKIVIIVVVILLVSLFPHLADFIK